MIGIDLSPIPTEDEKRILNAYRDQTVIEIDGQRAIVTTARYERNEERTTYRLAYSWRPA